MENKKTGKLTPLANGNIKRKHAILKKICFSSIFVCHPRRMLRIKSNCRFLLLAFLTISTLLLLFTVTEFEHQSSPIIRDIVYRTQNKIEEIKKNLPEDHLLVAKSNANEKLRVDKKYLLHLGLPANADDINIEVFCIKYF